MKIFNADVLFDSAAVEHVWMVQQRYSLTAGAKTAAFFGRGKETVKQSSNFHSFCFLKNANKNSTFSLITVQLFVLFDSLLSIVLLW